MNANTDSELPRFPLNDLLMILLEIRILHYSRVFDTISIEFFQNNYLKRIYQMFN